MPYISRSDSSSYTASVLDLTQGGMIVKSHIYGSMSRALAEAVCMYYEQIAAEQGNSTVTVPSGQDSTVIGTFSIVSRLTGKILFYKEYLILTRTQMSSCEAEGEISIGVINSDSWLTVKEDSILILST